MRRRARRERTALHARRLFCVSVRRARARCLLQGLLVVPLRRQDHNRDRVRRRLRVPCRRVLPLPAPLPRGCHWPTGSQCCTCLLDDKVVSPKQPWAQSAKYVPMNDCPWKFSRAARVVTTFQHENALKVATHQTASCGYRKVHNCPQNKPVSAINIACNADYNRNCQLLAC